MKRFVLACLFLLSFSRAVSANWLERTDFVDSLRIKPAVAHIIAPAILLGAGAFGLGKYYHNNINIPSKDFLADIRKNFYIRADDYLQYVPLAASMLLCIDKKNRDGWQDKILLAGTGTAIMGLLVTAGKSTIASLRPDGSKWNSFPSGHTAMAFLGAELVRMEYGPLWGVAAYFIAATTGVLRMYNERHWSNDVLGGAGVGILSAHIAYWLLPVERKLLGKINLFPYYSKYADGQPSDGLALNYTF